MLSRNVSILDKTRAELEAWRSDPFNRSFMYEKALADLTTCIEDDLKNVGLVLGSLGSLSHWYGVNAAYGIVEDKERAHSDFHEMFLCDLLRVKFSLAVSSKSQRPRLLSALRIGGKQNPRFSFAEHMTLLSNALSFGFTEDAIRIGDDILDGLENDLYYGVNARKTPHYMLELFGKLKNVSLPLEMSSEGLSDEHRNLLNLLESDKEAEFDGAVTSACDYHLQNSGEDTDDVNKEFSDPVYILFPSEIVAAYAVRKHLNKPVMRSSHPLIQDYWEIDRVAGVAKNNPQLESVAEKVKDF